MIGLLTRDIPEPKVILDKKGRKAALAVPKRDEGCLEAMKESAAFRSLSKDEQEQVLWKFQHHLNLRKEIANSN